MAAVSILTKLHTKQALTQRLRPASRHPLHWVDTRLLCQFLLSMPMARLRAEEQSAPAGR